MRKCRLCGGRLFLLGNLGALKWFRCEACGMDQSKREVERETK